ncbi:hypothetical protein TNCV_102791 [Trichonephila clavipes]|nr:hypothetical protein TNCV_102791 [Trichonephila clavipes]
MELSKIVLSPAWCSQIRIPDRRKNLALSREEFHRPRSDVNVNQVAKSNVSACVNINVALFSYTKAFGDGPRNFESW